MTLEGLGTREHPDPVQQAFIREQAAQCGYCLNGMIIATKALLLRSPHPTEADVLEALRHHLCRCGAHIEIMRAAMRAAGHVVEAPWYPRVPSGDYLIRVLAEDAAGNIAVSGRDLPIRVGDTLSPH